MKLGTAALVAFYFNLFFLLYIFFSFVFIFLTAIHRNPTNFSRGEICAIFAHLPLHGRLLQ